MLRRLHRRLMPAALVGLAVLVSAANARDDELLERAQRLLDARDASGALTLLLPEEPKRAGERAFDYLLGIAALDGGDPQRAVFALERVLAVAPDDLRARAEIARAYFLLGERSNAEREFRAVRGAASTPREAHAELDRYLAALAPIRTRLGGYVEGSFGRDSNINSATGLGSIALPALGGLIGELLPDARRRSANFLGAAVGLNLAHELTPALALLGTASGATKLNHDFDRFDTRVWDATLGARYASGPHVFTLAAQGQQFQLDHARFRDYGGALVQWQLALDARTQASLFAQRGGVRYTTQDVRDANRSIVGVALAHAFAGTAQAVVFASAYRGEERTRDAAVRHLGHWPFGLRLGVQALLAPRIQGFATLSLERRQYDAEDPLFLARRIDEQLDMRLGLSVRIADRWSVIPSVAWTDNRSNIALNAYDRLLGSLALRRDF